jgi:GNAT superfamily N-acetyltransferase
MDIRKATIQDAEQLHVLYSQLGYSTPAEKIQAGLVAAEKTNITQTFVAELDGVAVGALEFHLIETVYWSEPVGAITALVVDEKYRNQKVGEGLVKFAESLAKELGCVYVEVHSNRKRLDAHRFYERLGYVQTNFYFRKTQF